MLLLQRYWSVDEPKVCPVALFTLSIIYVHLTNSSSIVTSCKYWWESSVPYLIKKYTCKYMILPIVYQLSLCVSF